MLVAFLRNLPGSRFQLTELIDSDLSRTAEILEQYRNSRIDFVDATVMAIGERYHSTTILTLDRRDFQLFRPKHRSSFILLP